MSNSFFVSRELEDVVTPDILSENYHALPFVSINSKNYNVISVEKYDCNKIKLSFTCNESFKLNDHLVVKSGNVFGTCLECVSAYFKKIYYDPQQKKHICEIIIDKENFWSKNVWH